MRDAVALAVSAEPHPRPTRVRCNAIETGATVSPSSVITYLNTQDTSCRTHEL
jgi:hypothetical protein